MFIEKTTTTTPSTNSIAPIKDEEGVVPEISNKIFSLHKNRPLQEELRVFTSNNQDLPSDSVISFFNSIDFLLDDIPNEEKPSCVENLFKQLQSILPTKKTPDLIKIFTPFIVKCEYDRLLHFSINLLSNEERILLLKKMIKNNIVESKFQFTQLLQELDSCLPDLQSYIDLDFTILGPKGAEIIIKYLEKKRSYPIPDRCFVVINNTDSLKEKLNEISNAQDGRYSLLLYTLIKDETTHVIPLTIQKEGKSLIIINTDSISEKLFFEYWDNLFSDLNTIGFTIQYFFYVTCRQADGENCPIFAIRDTVQIQRMVGKDWEDDFVQFVKQMSKKVPIDSKNFTYYTFDALPPSMMKATQLRKKTITPYMENHWGLYSKPYTRKDGHEETLDISLQKHEKETISFVDGSIIKINGYAKKRNEKYTRLVLLHLLNNPSQMK